MMGFQEGWVSILSRTLVCGTVGLGYVGLPLAVEKAKAGFKTIGFDVQADKVDMVNRGENYIGDVVQEDLAALVEAGTLEATRTISAEAIASADRSGMDSFTSSLCWQRGTQGS